MPDFWRIASYLSSLPTNMDRFLRTKYADEAFSLEKIARGAARSKGFPA